MNKSLLILLVAGCFGLASAQEQPQGEPPARHPSPEWGMTHMSRMRRPDMFAELKLTDQQKSQMKDLRYETAKKEIELRSKLALSKLDLGRLVSADEPDKESIQKKLNEVAEQKTALEINKLNGWFEINKLLSPDQQKIWRRVLRQAVMERIGHDGEREMHPRQME